MLHSDLDGLGADDHDHYSLADGSRDFTGRVGGVTPSVGSDLTTKDYVDQLVQGIEWQSAVEGIAATPPGAPATDERWIVNINAVGEELLNTSGENIIGEKIKNIWKDYSKFILTNKTTSNCVLYNKIT